MRVYPRETTKENVINGMRSRGGVASLEPAVCPETRGVGRRQWAQPRRAKLRHDFRLVYRRAVLSRSIREIIGAIAVLACGCTTVDPGANFVVPNEAFDADYFYCHVEPEVLSQKKCGPGDPAAGDRENGCHFNSSAVSGMALVNHAPVDCGGGDHPVSRAAIATGSAASGNLQATSLEMNRDYLTAPLLIRPSGSNHPRAVFPTDDPAVEVLKTWATKP